MIIAIEDQIRIFHCITDPAGSGDHIIDSDLSVPISINICETPVIYLEPLDRTRKDSPHLRIKFGKVPDVFTFGNFHT